MTMHGNRDFILEAVKQNGVALQHASDELQRDYEREMAAKLDVFFSPVQHNTDY